MLGLKKRKSQPIEKKAGKVGIAVEKYQRRWAAWMAAKMGKLSIKRQKTVFLAFMLIASGYCLILIMGSGSGGLPDSGKITGTKLPLKNLVEIPSVDRELARLSGLKGYLDSLSRTPDGRKKRDSILSANPGLLDSLIIWENRFREKR